MNELYQCKILIVDDIKMNIDIMISILDGYNLRVAMNGKSALELIEVEKPDLILLDIMMPGIDGYEVCKQVKANEKTRDIPIIFVTAKRSHEDEQKGLELGAIDYIIKPFNKSIIRVRVYNHLMLKLSREQVQKQNEIIERQNKKLVETTRLKEDVERMTRHDLKSPLNAILSLPQVIRKQGGLNNDQLHYLDVIQKSAYRMLNMINLSIDLYKIETGQYNLNQKPVDICAIIKTIHQELSALIHQKELQFTVFLDDLLFQDGQTCMISGEELLCYSLFANLLKNSVEASPRNQTITIKMTHGENIITISIHNLGTMPDAIREQFFDKYVSGKKQGAGLGTYSAKLITELHEGSIRLETNSVTGTRLILCFPNYQRKILD